MSQQVEKSLANLRLWVEVLRPALKKIGLGMLEDPQFATAYGSAGKHHGYEGGLAVHTSEVVEYAFGMTKILPDVNEEVVVAAALMHDWMKIREYDPAMPGVGTYSDGTPVRFAKTPFRLLIRHVAGSYAEFVKAAAAFTEEELPEETRLKIGHAMLAHHGRKEFGSPVEPETIEAYIVHYADMFSYFHGPGRVQAV